MPLAMHDIAVTDVKPLKTVVGQGYNVNINTTITNLGDYTETFNVMVIHGGIPPPDQIDPEIRALFWSMGDVNKDGYIDLIDLDRIVAKYGWEGPPGGIPEDINSDGTVNFLDVNICTGNQGLDIWTYFGIEKVWFHVQFIDPPGPGPGPHQMVLDVKYWFQVDEVTVDMMLTPIEIPGPQIFVEYKCGYWTFDPKNPISTKWNQIDPEMGPTRCLHLTSWIDNGNGVLDYCDTIDMTPLYPDPGPVEYYHVEFLSISLKLTPKPSPPVVPPPPKGPMYLDSELSYYDVDLSNPVPTYWFEVYPYFGRFWRLSSWENFYGLSPSDNIVLALKDEFGVPIPGTEVEYHVDKLTVAMNLTSMEDLREHIVKFEESLKEFKQYHWTNPVSTQWHEVNPEYCRQWHILDWYDSQPNGILDYCDYILMIDKHTGWMEWFHVESLSTDMWLTISHDIAVTNVTKLKTVVCQGYPMRINVTVENQGYYTENFDVSVYANTTAIATQLITLTGGSSTTITFTWNVPTDFPKGNYTISAHATPLPPETDDDLSDNTFIDGWVVVSMVGDLTGGTASSWDFVPDGKVEGKDQSVVLKCFGSWPGAPPPMIWNPNCDINNDEKVDGRDLSIIQKHFGEADP